MHARGVMFNLAFDISALEQKAQEKIIVIGVVLT